MGVHYVKGSLVQSGRMDPARPQALVYEVRDESHLQLVALEYVVFQAARVAAPVVRDHRKLVPALTR